MSLEDLKNGIIQATDRVRYPAHGDGYSLYRDVSSPCMYASAGFFVVNMGSLIGNYAGIVPDEVREVMRNYVGPVSDLVSKCYLTYCITDGLYGIKRAT